MGRCIESKTYTYKRIISQFNKEAEQAKKLSVHLTVDAQSIVLELESIRKIYTFKFDGNVQVEKWTS